MLRFWPEPKRCKDSGQKRNERTQSTFLDPIVMFGSFRSVLLLCKKPCSVAFNDLIRAGTETMQRFGPETKRTHPIHIFGPNSDVLFVSVSFVTVQKTMLGSI